eukprot:g2913.t1
MAMRFAMDKEASSEAWRLMTAEHQHQQQDVAEKATAVEPQRVLALDAAAPIKVPLRGGGDATAAPTAASPLRETRRGGDATAASTAASKHVVRLVCISDTHGSHRHIKDIPSGDILVHAGDITETGELAQLSDFAAWLEELPHKHKVVVAGNHDITLAPEFYQRRGAPRFHRHRHVKEDPAKCRAALTAAAAAAKGIVYLEDEAVTVDGVRIFGSPWQPRFHDWAFNVARGSEIRNKWEAMPAGGTVDVLVTHGPPVGHGDCGHDLANAGCVDLLLAVQRKIRPRLHVFGHIHGGAGATTDGQTVFVNAATCAEDYQPVNPPVVVDLEVAVAAPTAACCTTQHTAAAADDAGGAAGGDEHERKAPE